VILARNSGGGAIARRLLASDCASTMDNGSLAACGLSSHFPPQQAAKCGRVASIPGCVNPAMTGLIGVVVLAWADDEPDKAQNQTCRPVLQLSWRTRAQHLAQHQADVERADVDQQTLENILSSVQGAASHRTGFVAMGKGSFHELASPPQQTFAILAPHPLTICERYVNRRSASMVE